jgi:hypothetical protein
VTTEVTWSARSSLQLHVDVIGKGYKRQNYGEVCFHALHALLMLDSTLYPDTAGSTGCLNVSRLFTQSQWYPSL